MKIRAYTADDDAALMALERQCPRGAPTPFVHFRHRFAERAEIFGQWRLLVIEARGALVAAAAAAIKATQVRGEPRPLGYIFDVRVAPDYRRHGLAKTLIEHLEADLLAAGCVGAYAHIVATNRPSTTLFATLGYERSRQIRYLTFPPTPLLVEAPVRIVRRPTPCLDEIRRHYGDHDLFVDDVAAAVAPYGLEQWQAMGAGASLCLYDQSRIFFQTPADAPWPTAAQVARRGRHWRLFHLLGSHEALHDLFITLRDEAVSARVDTLSLIVDTHEPMPPFIYTEAATQREYLVYSRAFGLAWDGTFGAALYCDPREL